MTKLAAALLFSALAGGVATPALAHHSYAEFDRNRTVTIEGTIEEIAWSNPHVTLVVRTADAVEYRIEWSSIRRLQYAGVPDNPFAVGDAVVISGAAHRDPDIRILTLPTRVDRPADGWTWSRGAPLERPADHRSGPRGTR